MVVIRVDVRVIVEVLRMQLQVSETVFSWHVMTDLLDMNNIVVVLSKI